jgi:hypothetical protein
MKIQNKIEYDAWRAQVSLLPEGDKLQQPPIYEAEEIEDDDGIVLVQDKNGQNIVILPGNFKATDEDGNVISIHKDDLDSEEIWLRISDPPASS